MALRSGSTAARADVAQLQLTSERDQSGLQIGANPGQMIFGHARVEDAPHRPHGVFDIVDQIGTASGDGLSLGIVFRPFSTIGSTTLRLALSMRREASRLTERAKYLRLGRMCSSSNR